jgi:hypothetical protein
MKPPLPQPPNPLAGVRVCQKCGAPPWPTRLDDMSMAMTGKCWVCVQNEKKQPAPIRHGPGRR